MEEKDESRFFAKLSYVSHDLKHSCNFFLCSSLPSIECHFKKKKEKKPYLKFKGFFPDFSLTILSLFIKVSYLFSFKCIYFDIDGINTQNTFSRGLNTTPLIHHVFNVEQDQIIRDNVFDIRAWIVWEKTQRERKTKDSQSHELSRKCSMAPKGSGLFFSMSPSTMKSIEDASEHFFFKTLDLPQWSIA